MSEQEQSARDELGRAAIRQAHAASGLSDATLLDRYSGSRDLVAFMDETHRATPNGDIGYYGMSAVVFHSDDLPEIRRDLEDIAAGQFWHSKEAFKDPLLRGRIAQMSELVAERSAMPAIVFDVRPHEISDTQERSVRDVCLDRALRVLDREGITDVVLDNFPRSQQHNVHQDETILRDLRGAGAVADDMWMHHANMRDEHGLWTADTVAWSVQRHHFGERLRDSQHIAPLRGHLQEIYAQTGSQRGLKTPAMGHLVGSAGATDRVAPVYSLQERIQHLRENSAPLQARAAQTPEAQQSLPVPDVKKAPPIQGPEGPSRSL